MKVKFPSPDNVHFNALRQLWRSFISSAFVDIRYTQCNSNSVFRLKVNIWTFVSVQDFIWWCTYVFNWKTPVRQTRTIQALYSHYVIEENVFFEELSRIISPQVVSAATKLNQYPHKGILFTGNLEATNSTVCTCFFLVSY